MVTSRRGQACRALLDELNEQRRQCRSAMRSMFNSSFGATFLTDTGRESALSYHIHQYADVYTSKPENFMLYPPEAWLHVPYDIKIMPHHVKVVCYGCPFQHGICYFICKLYCWLCHFIYSHERTTLFTNFV